MNRSESGHGNLLNEIIHRTLKPRIKKIDAAGYYPSEYLKELGRAGLLPSQRDTAADIMSGGVRLVEETARACMTTAFNLWCHLAATTYLRESGNPYLVQNVLPLLENGEMLGGTGLSNPMKYYSGLESLCLRAEKVVNGYIVTGTLPSVSNLGPDHGFGIIASLDENRRVMAFVPCAAEGLTLREKSSFLGLNGSATYVCEFNGVFVPDEWMISEQADAFVAKIRSVFLLFQIPLGLGVTDAAIRCMYKSRGRQDGCSRYIPDQPETLEFAIGSNLFNAASRPSRYASLRRSRLFAAKRPVPQAERSLLPGQSDADDQAFGENAQHPGSRRARSLTFSFISISGN
ncbi:MAG: putative acyl-CoA dehydrogenase [Paenibacillus sp.]|nr:putative acyl-CoA dehydrogenase [Paenibacillus sp.]